jgi:hypothetical protein
LFSGLGSWWSGRWRPELIAGNMRRVFPVLVGLLLIHALSSSLILEQTLRFGLGIRLVVAVLLLSVLGFMMGIPFPTGVRWVGRRQSSVVPWLWGINGVTSVLGSALATAFSIHFGFRLTLVIATAAYATAAFLFLSILSKAEEPDTSVTLPDMADTTGLEIA